MKSRLVPGLLLLLVACAEPELPRSRIVLPWQAPLLCGDAAAMGAMEAMLYVEGFGACPLEVDGGDFSVSGTCGPIPLGEQRGLLLAYTMGTPSTALAYIIGFADLRESSVDAETTRVTLNLVPDDERVQLFYDPDDVTALGPRDGGAGPLYEAQLWARDTILAQLLSVDLDADGCPNLNELCDGTLDQLLSQDCD